MQIAEELHCKFQNQMHETYISTATRYTQYAKYRPTATVPPHCIR